MLDDIKYIAQRDRSDALGLLAKQPLQLIHEFKFSKQSQGDIQQIVVCGMGGSALGAEIALNWPNITLPIIINRSYDLPSFANKNSLIVISSYSGNTEEAISALHHALLKKLDIVVITTGGKLKELAVEHQLNCIVLPANLQPRMAAWFNLKAFLEILYAYNAVSDPQELLQSAFSHVSTALTTWGPTVPTPQNLAKQIAEEIAGKTAVIYAGPSLSSAAYKWKININENAKNTAFYNLLPEVNHNEMIGWTEQPIEKPFAIIELLSSLDEPIINTRFSIMNNVLSGRMPHPITVNAVGSSQTEQLLWTILLGDFVGVYLALINNVDPTPIDVVEMFKEKLHE